VTFPLHCSGFFDDLISAAVGKTESDKKGLFPPTRNEQQQHEF